MKILGWNLDRGEHRTSDYSQAVAEALLTAASTPEVNTGSLSVLEACVSLIADPFLVATTSGAPLPARMLYQASRDLLRYGNSVWAVETGTGSLVLRRAARWAVEGGSLDPDSWVYPLEFSAPNGDTIKRRLPAASVVHLRLGSDPGADWIGQAPWRSASLSSEALTELERGIRDESRTINGRIWTAPDGATDAQADGMARNLRALKGGRQVVAETTNQGWGQGKLASPRADWTPVKVGMAHEPGNVAMRDSVQASLSAAYGVPAAYLSSTSTGPGLREAKRLAFLNKSLPLAALMASELSEKLTPVSIQWDDLASQGVDVHLRARAIAPLAELGADKESLLRLVGLPLSLPNEVVEEIVQAGPRE